MARIVCWVPPVGRWLPYRWKLPFHRRVFGICDRLFQNASTTFYTVQNQEDVSRLWRDGAPFPTKETRAHFGPGVYAWSKQADAGEYRTLLQRIASEPFQIIEFRVWNCCLRRFRQLDVNSIPEPEIDIWINKHSLLGEGPFEPHGYQYLMRAVGFREVGDPAVEHYFHRSVFAHLWFY